jgi:hypothetical protein
LAEQDPEGSKTLVAWWSPWMAAVIRTMIRVSSSTTPEVLGRSSPLFRQLNPSQFVGEEGVVGREVDDVGRIIVVWVSEGADRGEDAEVDEALWFQFNLIHRGWHQTRTR